LLSSMEFLWIMGSGFPFLVLRRLGVDCVTLTDLLKRLDRVAA